MTEPELFVVAEVKMFLVCHDATATSVKPSGGQEIVNEATTAEIGAALADCGRAETASTRTSNSQLGTFDGSSRVVISWFLTGH